MHLVNVTTINRKEILYQIINKQNTQQSSSKSKSNTRTRKTNLKRNQHGETYPTNNQNRLLQD